LRFVSPRQRFTRSVSLITTAATTAALLTAANQPATAQIQLSTSSVTGSDGKVYSVTNHLKVGDLEAGHHPRRPHEYLLAWTGDSEPRADGTQEPDFLAIIDVSRGLPTYGKVVNTATLSPLTGNEPHHMQYTWQRGQKLYAGGLLGDTIFVFDIGQLPEVTLSGVALPTDTPCGSAPDAFSVLRDGTAYGTMLGGPNVSGPCTYSNGETRSGNGFAGTPGEVVHIGTDGRILAEVAAASATGEDPALCHSIPALPVPTCANPHGIAVREDLNAMLTSDFVEVRNLVGGHGLPDPFLARNTIRSYDISDRARPRLRTVMRLAVGPRNGPVASQENLLVMETAVTHQARHRGAFASTANGAVYYTPDFTAAQPVWREILDDATAFTFLYPVNPPTSDSDGGGWLQVSPDDRFLFHTVMYGGVSSPAHQDSGMVYALDISRLLAAGTHTSCEIDSSAEITAGGAEPDCPVVRGAVPIVDPTSGGAHWGAMDNFAAGSSGYFHETDRIRRLAVSNYFVAVAGFDGDHRICLVNVGPAGRLSLDTSFRDEVTRRPCLDFDRAGWPHGDTGAARPHGVVFAVAEADLR
jgi:hypothetical protein